MCLTDNEESAGREKLNIEGKKDTLYYEIFEKVGGMRPKANCDPSMKTVDDLSLSVASKSTSVSFK